MDKNIAPADFGQLLTFMLQALDPKSEAVDTNILRDVSDQGLYFLASKMHEFLRQPPLREGLSRDTLLLHIGDLLDDFHTRPVDHFSSGVTTINPSEQYREQVDNSGVHMSNAIHNSMVLGGSAGVSEASLRIARRSVGWISCSQLAKQWDIPPPYVKDAIEAARNAKIEVLTTQFITEFGDGARDKAERWVQAEFISKKLHAGVPRHKRNPYDTSMRRTDYDISEQAVPAVQAILMELPGVQRLMQRRSAQTTCPDRT